MRRRLDALRQHAHRRPVGLLWCGRADGTGPMPVHSVAPGFKSPIFIGKESRGPRFDTSSSITILRVSAEGTAALERQGLRVTGGSLVAAAEDALDQAGSNPIGASALARDILRCAESVGDAHAACVAERAIGLAARERHHLKASAVHLRKSVRIAERAGLPARAAETRLSLVGTLALLGDSNGALREADLAGAVLRGVMRARLESQRARLHLHLGRVEDALDGYRRALRRFAAVMTCSGRPTPSRAGGWPTTSAGAVRAAEADMRRAESLYVQLGETRMAASTLQHVAVVIALHGDVPEALQVLRPGRPVLRRSPPH